MFLIVLLVYIVACVATVLNMLVLCCVLYCLCAGIELSVLVLCWWCARVLYVFVLCVAVLCGPLCCVRIVLCFMSVL